MRDWCIVLDALSFKDARRIGRVLRGRQLDVELESRRKWTTPQASRPKPKPRVWCYAYSEAAIRSLAEEIRETLLRASLWEALQSEPRVWVWNEHLHVYVDPEHPDENPDSDDLDPDEIRWRVRLELERVSEFRRVRRQVPKLQRPVIDTGPRHIDLGATDASDAEEVARAARALDGVYSATPSEIRGRLQRWLLRQHLVGNYAPPSGDN